MLITGIKSKPVYAPLQPDLRGRLVDIGADPIVIVEGVVLGLVGPDAGARLADVV